jgi:hypothetical protein
VSAINAVSGGIQTKTSGIYDRRRCFRWRYEGVQWYSRDRQDLEREQGERVVSTFQVGSNETRGRHLKQGAERKPQRLCKRLHLAIKRDLSYDTPRTVR